MLMIKSVATVPFLCTTLAFCGSIETVSVAQATSIDFETAPLYPAPVDSYANLYPGVTLASNNKWFANNSVYGAYDNIDGKAIFTPAGNPLSIRFQPAVRDVVMDLASDFTRQPVTVGIEGYLNGHLVFSNDFATHPYLGSVGEVWEVRAQTIGIVDQLVIARKDGVVGVVLDNLSFIPVPEPTGWVVAGVAMVSIGCLMRRVAYSQP